MRDTESRHLRLVDTAFGPHLLVVDGSRLYAIDQQSRGEVEAAVVEGEQSVRELLARFGMLPDRPYIGAEPLIDPPLRSLSLAIAQRCNLACSYCYAQGGGFGGEERAMPWSVAAASVRRLVEECPPGERVFIGFLGGEPLTHRALLRRTTEYAAEIAGRQGVSVGLRSPPTALCCGRTTPRSFTVIALPSRSVSTALVTSTTGCARLEEAAPATNPSSTGWSRCSSTARTCRFLRG